MGKKPRQCWAFEDAYNMEPPGQNRNGKGGKVVNLSGLKSGSVGVPQRAGDRGPYGLDMRGEPRPRVSDAAPQAQPFSADILAPKCRIKTRQNVSDCYKKEMVSENASAGQNVALTLFSM
jgi:hypothetical protein